MKHAYFVCLFLCLTVTFSARPASAATEKVLHSFQAYRDGDGSEANASLTADGAGNFYGTTPYGGLGYGVVFELSPNGKGGWNETILYSFTGVL